MSDPGFHTRLLAPLFAALVAVSTSAAAQTLPELLAPAGMTVDEGDAGSQTVTLEYSLDRVATTDVTFRLEAITYDYAAQPGLDFATFAPRTLTIPKGQTRVSTTTSVFGDRIVENDQPYWIRVMDVVGANLATHSEAEIVIANDDASSVGDWRVYDDAYKVAGIYDRRIRGKTLTLQENDRFDASWYGTPTIEILEEPRLGTLSGNMQTSVHYLLQDPRAIGTDSFRYRICLESGECREGRATLHMRPRDAIAASGPGHSGYASQSSMSTVGFRLDGSALAPPVEFEMAMGVDFWPQDEWDAGGDASRSVIVPAAPDGTTQERVLMFHAPFGFSTAAGIDDDGDGLLSEPEARCRYRYGPCEMRYTVGDQPVRWIVRMHSDYEVPTTATLSIADIPLDGDALVATTAGVEADGWDFHDWRFSWNEPSLVGGVALQGVVALRDPDGALATLVPASVGRDGDDASPLVLVPGRRHDIRLAAGATQRLMFVDIPEGALRFTVRVSGDAVGGTPFHVGRLTDALDAASTEIAEAPPRADAVAAGRSSPAGETVVIEGAALAPGRWYVVPDNTEGAGTTSLAVTATVEAVAPLVRPGSYFNAERSGSGLFLYPAGSQWTGLWYTYFTEGRPTWYYLQGDAPGADGLRRSEIWRATWDGTTRHLTSVGEAVLTPTDGDRFTLSYRIDGVVGSQPFAALGRGCPAHDGGVLDISSTWFDPARTGTGYSVQMWPDYEYHAAFVYDPQGVPMFLAAESATFGGDEATLDLQRLVGACPTCAFVPSDRTTVGTYVRRLAGAGLASIEMDALWDDGNPPYRLDPGAWSSVHAVQLLGGTTSTQGCDP